VRLYFTLSKRPVEPIGTGRVKGLAWHVSCGTPLVGAGDEGYECTHCSETGWLVEPKAIDLAEGFDRMQTRRDNAVWVAEREKKSAKDAKKTLRRVEAALTELEQMASDFKTRLPESPINEMHRELARGIEEATALIRSALKEPTDSIGTGDRP
jgi:hypothetical protein